MKQPHLNPLTEKQKEVLKSIRISRVILPIAIGIGVVIYLLYRQFDLEEFKTINWTAHTLFWIVACLVFVVLRHLAYAMRLRILSQKEFSWRKCIELIFIWEFSSAVSPTSLGGSAVALFVISQEKLSAARTTAIVLYTVVLDTIFFIGTLPILFLLFGAEMIRPDMNSLSDIDGWGYTFMSTYVLMAAYGAFFFYGLFINPTQLKRVAVGITGIGFLRKWRRNAVELGNDFIIASKELKMKNKRFHLSAFLSTMLAWSFKFILIMCLIIALVNVLEMEFWNQLRLYARLEAMFVIMAFSPTPGGSGFAEFVFGGFLSDYVPRGIALIVASMWRIFTYYSYLLAGAIVIPNWINKILSRKK